MLVPRAWHAAWLVAVLAVVVASPARADETRAEALFQEGQRLFDQGQVDRACEVFGESLSLMRTAGTLINLARCHAKQGKNALAWREYREVVQLATAAGQSERARGAADLAAQLESMLGKLRIDIAEPTEGVRILHNGARLPEEELGAMRPVDPGNQVIEATIPGSLPWRTTVEVAAGEEITVKVPGLSSRAQAPPSPPPASDDGLGTMTTVGIALGATGVVAAIAGGVLGGLTLSDMSEVEDDDALCGADKTCTPAGLDQVASAETKGIAATVLLGVGAAAMAAGATLLVIGGSEEPEADVGFAPLLAPGIAGGMITGSF